MRLGVNDEIAMTLGNETIYLRPTLRAAFRLEQKYDGFHNIFNAVLGGSLTAISDVIKEGCGQSTALTDYLDTVGDQPLMVCLDLLIGPVAKFLLTLSGNDTVEVAAKGQLGEVTTFLDYHTRLFRIATGWLGWTPEQAWDATPAEIIEARKGRMEMLTAIFGGKNDDAPTSKPEDHAAKRRRLSALGDLTVTNMAQVPSCQ